MATRWQDWMNLLIGIWLLVSPVYLAFPAGPGSVSAWNSYLCGGLIAILSVVALLRPASWEEWLQLIVGLWLLLASFVLGITEQRLALWNNVISGLIIVLVSVSALNWIRIRPND